MAKKRQSQNGSRGAKNTPSDGMLDAMTHIWLAGLGALSRARQGAPQIMQELAAEGSRVQAVTRSTAEKSLNDLMGGMKATIDSGVSQMRSGVGQMRGHAGDVLDNLETMFQTRVHRALTQLGVPSAEDVHSLSERVEKLDASINKFAKTRKTSAKHRTGPARKTRSSARAITH